MLSCWQTRVLKHRPETNPAADEAISGPSTLLRFPPPWDLLPVEPQDRLAARHLGWSYHPLLLLHPACTDLPIAAPQRSSFQPCCSTIFLQIARPTPFPEYSSRVCRRWKMTKICSLWSAAMPIPLSSTESRHLPLILSAEILIIGGRFLRNFDGVANQVLEKLD